MTRKNSRYFAKRIQDFYRGNFHNDGLRGVARVTLGLGMTAFGPLVRRLGVRDKLCTSCGWKGSRFMPFLATGYVSFDTLCPVCESSPRHRAHRIFYEKILHFEQRSGRMLYFAPERNLEYFRQNPRLEVKTSNYPDGDGDYHVDILDMPFQDGEWDYIVCHRVIEHLRDDRAGMAAFLRVLKPGGLAIISVPINVGRERSVEYGRPNPLENEHYYSYGEDFAERIPAGFEVTAYRFSETFSEAEYRSLGLIEDFVFVCRKADAMPA